jgi:hypothetical protein
VTSSNGDYLDHIPQSSWLQAVRTLLDDDGAEILTRRGEEIFVGIGAGTRVFRVTGTASVGRHRTVDWTMIVKILTQNRLSFQSTSTDATRWDYWKREWHVYRSSWQQNLTGPLIAPRCFGSGEITLNETDEQLAWIAMQDLRSAPHQLWSEPQFKMTARHLGVFNGRYLCGAPQPTDSWLSRNWLRGWTEQTSQVMHLLPAAAGHPVAGRVFTRELIEDLCLTWEQREKLYAALEQLPKSFGHNDVFPRNVFLGEREEVKSVAIDWAFCGPAPVGQELSALVGASQVFMESRPDRWDDLERACLEGYTGGLREADWAGAEEVLTGYVLSTALRFGIGSLPPVLALTLTTEHMDMAGRLFGCSYDEFLANAAAVMRFQQHRIHHARALVGL